MIVVWDGTENSMEDTARPGLCNESLSVPPQPNHLEKWPRQSIRYHTHTHHLPKRGQSIVPTGITRRRALKEVSAIYTPCKRLGHVRSLGQDGGLGTYTPCTAYACGATHLGLGCIPVVV